MVPAGMRGLEASFTEVWSGQAQVRDMNWRQGKAWAAAGETSNSCAASSDSPG